MNLAKLDNEVLENLALWLGIPVKRLKVLGEVIPDIEENHYHGFLDCQVVSWREGQVRRLTHKIVKFLREHNRYYILDSIKKIRQLRRKKLVEINHCRFTELDMTLRRKLSLPPIDWRGNQAVVCLSHDLDCVEDYEFSREVYDLNRKYNIRSTFNFLTHWGYQPESAWLKELDSNGFEIGLHGYTHDIAIGIRPAQRIIKELSLALEKLNFSVKGYRAPAFAVTPRLLKSLKELGIKYDSSMKTVSCYGQAVETFYPYRYPGIGIWEIPLTIQDDRVFRDLYLSDEEGLGVIKELAQRVVNIGGVMVINNHPRLIKERFYYYEELLKWIAALDNVWICTMSDVIEFMEEREHRIIHLKEDSCIKTTR